MNKLNEEVIEKIQLKFKDADLPMPFVSEGKNITEEEALIVHIFMEHIYSYYDNMKVASKEIQSYLKENKSLLLEELGENTRMDIEEFPKAWDAWVKDITVLPTFAELKKFRKNLKKEMKLAMSITMEELEKTNKKAEENSE